MLINISLQFFTVYIDNININVIIMSELKYIQKGLATKYIKETLNYNG